MLKGTLRQAGKDESATSENVLAALAGTEFFWLDLDDRAANGEVAELLSVHFGFHPLAVQAAERFVQRPRIDEYDDFVFLVARGADPQDKGIAEVHCFWTDRYVVTVHRGDCPALAGVHERLERHPASQGASPQIVIVYLIVSSLVDGFFPFLSDFDDRIDALEDDILKAPDRGPAGRALRHEAGSHRGAQARGTPTRHDGEHQRGRDGDTRVDQRGYPVTSGISTTT